MGSKGRIPHPHLRHPLPGAVVVHSDPFGPGVQSLPAPFPPFDVLPPPEVIEQKLAAQHVEMQRLATENKRLAATHGTLRHELAAAQHELQLLHTQIGVVQSKREQERRNLMDKIAKMEAELKNAEPVRLELQQARTEAEKLLVGRQELMSKVQKLTQDLHRAHTEVQQIPGLMSELERLRQEYQRCRVSYDSEKKLFNDHLESLQVMEKNYATMAREVEKLRAELTNAANVDIRSGGPYGGTTANNESEASVRSMGQNVYEDGYAVPQVQGHAALPANSGAGTPGTVAASIVGAAAGTPAYVPSQPGSAPTKIGFEGPRGPAYDAQRGHSYDAHRGAGYDIPRGSFYDAQRLPGYDVQRGPYFDALRGVAQRGTSYDPSRANAYDPLSRGVTGTHVQGAPSNNLPYGSATPPAHTGNVYEAQARGGNFVRNF